MLEIQEIIIKIRARLKDENYDDLRFSDTEIIDGINAITRTLISSLKLNKTQKSQNLTFEHRFLKIPHLLYIQSAKLDKIILVERTDIDKDAGFSELLITDEGLSVTPFKEGVLSVVYGEYENLGEEDYLPLPEIALDCVVYGTLCLMLEINTQDENYNKIGFFKSLYKESQNILIAYLNNLYSKPKSSSKVVRI